MEFVYNAVERLVVFENTGVAFGPVTIYWLVLEITKVKPLKPSWLIALCAYPRFQKWLEHCYSPHAPPSPEYIELRCQDEATVLLRKITLPSNS